MTNLEIIRKIASQEFEDEDGFKYRIELLPGLAEAEIEERKRDFPNQKINKELIEILKTTRGWENGGIEGVLFDSIGQFGFESLISESICLGRDGLGNHWVMDLKTNGELGKVYFVCHDPPVIVIQSESLIEYLSHLLEFYTNPVENSINIVHDNNCFEVWESINNLESLSNFKKINPDINDHLTGFEESKWLVFDLRDGIIGMGFPWGINGPNPQIIRISNLDIWLLKKH